MLILFWQSTITIKLLDFSFFVHNNIYLFLASHLLIFQLSRQIIQKILKWWRLYSTIEYIKEFKRLRLRRGNLKMNSIVSTLWEFQPVDNVEQILSSKTQIWWLKGKQCQWNMLKFCKSYDKNKYFLGSFPFSSLCDISR